MNTPLVNEKFKCYVCARELSVNHSGGTGYASLIVGDQKVCYDCVARMDAAEMLKGNSIVLYLTKRVNQDRGRLSYGITNWPGTLYFPTGPFLKISRHNIGKTRYDAWFTGPDGALWHGVNIGDSQICRCHRLKKQNKDIEPLKESAYLKPYPYTK